MSEIKKRRVWNRVNEQVYSLATYDIEGKINMNIATYVVPITMDIKRYVIAVYKNTQTYKNIFENKNNKSFILQALSKGQINLVKILGKKSGLKYDKQKYLEKNNLLTESEYLKNSAFILEMVIEKYIEVGDHDLIIAKVLSVLENNYDKILLNTEDLQNNKIIS